MDEKDTFNILKRPPIDEMIKIMEVFNQKPYEIPPVYELASGFTVERITYYPNILWHKELIDLLERHYWTYDEYCLALEKKAIIDQIEIYNSRIKFPKDLINRAKRFFPNAEFTQASIKLND